MGARVQVDNVFYRYPGSPWIISGVDLTVQDGEYLLIFGANGSGKSTMGHLFNGLAPHFFGGTLQGRVAIDGVDTRETPVSELFSRVGLVMQNADAQLFNPTVEDELAFGLESLGLDTETIDTRISEIAQELEIDHLLNRTPESLSGGEKRRLAIGAILCMEPSVVVLDEPFANLDWVGSRKLRKIMKRIRSRGQTMVVIEQRMDGYFHDADRCVILREGRVRFDGGTHRAMESLVKYDLIPRYPSKRKRAKAKTEPVLQVENLSCQIDKNPILKDVNLEIYRGEIVALVGPNGSGKTTLIKHFNGLIRPPKGCVQFMGEDVHDKSTAGLVPRIGFSFQNPNHQFFKSSVEEELRVGAKVNPMDSQERLDEICGIFKLQQLMSRSPFKLSEGEKKRVAISSILAMGPEVLVLDEPTAGQDGRFRQALAGTLLQLNQKGITIVMVTHDLAFARAVADRWIVLRDGTVAAAGDPDSFGQLENHGD